MSRSCELSVTVIDHPKVPWFNDEIKQLKSKCHRLEKKAIMTNLPSSDWNNYRRVRNQYSAHLKSADVNYYSNLIDWRWQNQLLTPAILPPIGP